MRWKQWPIERYREVMDAYLSGLEDCLLAGGDIEKIHSVASFFVSRVDTKIDPKLPAGSPAWVPSGRM